MPPAQDPTVQRRRLRVELKKARDAAGLRQADVARAMDWSESKLIRIENGSVGISTNDLRALLQHYTIEETRVNELLDLARSSRGPSTFDRYSSFIQPGFREYLGYEASATVIQQYEPILVPGLLQTEEYARAILKDAYEFSGDDQDKAWELRQLRQELHEVERSPQMTFLVDESVVRQQVGGPRVMRRQLVRMKEYASEPHVMLYVLPDSAGAHRGMTTGAFVVLEFADENLDDLAYLEREVSSTIRDNPEETARYLELFSDLVRGKALDTGPSLALIDELIDQMAHAGKTDEGSAGRAVK